MGRFFPPLLFSVSGTPGPKKDTTIDCLWNSFHRPTFSQNTREPMATHHWMEKHIPEGRRWGEHSYTGCSFWHLIPNVNPGIESKSSLYCPFTQLLQISININGINSYYFPNRITFWGHFIDSPAYCGPNTKKSPIEACPLMDEHCHLPTQITFTYSLLKVCVHMNIGAIS